MKDFIGIWDNVVPFRFCQELINQFEVANNLKFNNTPNDPLSRMDWCYFLNYHDKHAPEIYQWLTPAFTEYTNHFQQLKQVKLFPSEIKMQKTPPGGGFHSWHYESSSWEGSQRELVWMIYLNDLPDGEGETEFLYQKIRIKPTTGTIVIFPAGMTHVHRGNTVFTTDKYILTGWFNKIPS